MKLLYPLIMQLSKWVGKGNILVNKHKIQPEQSFYLLSATSLGNEEISFDNFRNKKVLIVNTASDCGYTSQYEELQQLWEQYQNELIVIAFPSNDFKEQERGSEADIAAFCRFNYGVTFPLIKKSIVKRGEGQHPVFRWLTHAALNGWNDHQPDWNFSKFLINEAGVLTHYFGPGISPLDRKVKKAILEPSLQKQAVE